MENKVQSEAITFKGNGSDGLFIEPFALQMAKL